MLIVVAVAAGLATFAVIALLAWRGGVEAVVAHARCQKLAQVEGEGWTATPEQAAAAGFTPLCPPGTREQAGPETGYVRRLHDGAVAEPPYYGQTTSFTCGAVTALVAQAHAGALEPAALDRRAELTLWREAPTSPSANRSDWASPCGAPGPPAPSRSTSTPTGPSSSTTTRRANRSGVPTSSACPARTPPAPASPSTRAP